MSEFTVVSCKMASGMKFVIESGNENPKNQKLNKFRISNKQETSLKPDTRDLLKLAQCLEQQEIYNIFSFIMKIIMLKWFLK